MKSDNDLISVSLVRSEELGVRSGGAAHKNVEAPRSINRAMPPEDGILVTSHQSPNSYIL